MPYEVFFRYKPWWEDWVQADLDGKDQVEDEHLDIIDEVAVEAQYGASQIRDEDLFKIITFDEEASSMVRFFY